MYSTALRPEGTDLQNARDVIQNVIWEICDRNFEVPLLDGIEADCLLPNTHCKAFYESCKIDVFPHRSTRNFSKIRLLFSLS